MPTAGFLESIYRGGFNISAFESFEARQGSEKVNQLLQGFTGLIERYPTRAIEEQGRIPEEMLKEMGELGLFGASIPEAYGGLGFDLWEYMKVVEEMAGQDISMALVSLAHLSIGVKGIILFGTEEQKLRYLKPAAAGEMIFSYALTEPRIGSDAQHIETAAALSDDGRFYVLNGQKTYITNANYAGGLTVFAQLNPNRPGYMGAFIVETAWDGVKIGKDMPKMGLKASSTATIQFKNVRVPLENLIGAPGEGFKIAMTILNYGRLGLGAASVGMMNRSLADMLKRSASRVQFGVPIGSFPLIQEKMVKAAAHSMVSSAMNNFTASLLENDPTGNVAIESSHCKLFGTTRAWDVLYDALQVAGGAGYLATQPYEKRMRDFRVSTVFEGTTEIHSIYPPLFLIRQIVKDMKKRGLSSTGRITFLLQNLFKRIDWPLKLDDKNLAKASRLARANFLSIRRMVFLGLLVHGKRAMEKEFFLRRITTLSLYTFGLLATLALIKSRPGADTPSPEDLNLIRYFTEEAREARTVSKRFFDSRKERLNGQVFHDLTTRFKDK